MNMQKGYQATRIYLALNLCLVVFDIVDTTSDEVEVVKEKLKECTKSLDITLSAGARREYLSKMQFLKDYVEVIDESKVYLYWAYLAYACADLVFDCKIACPLYFKGKVFEELLLALETVQGNLCEDIEDLENEGTNLYCKLSID